MLILSVYDRYKFREIKCCDKVTSDLTIIAYPVILERSCYMCCSVPKMWRHFIVQIVQKHISVRVMKGSSSVYEPR